MSVGEKAEKIKAIIFDVDGVLTDGGIIYDNSGMEIKRFHVKDGQIISHLKKAGMIVGAITGRDSKVVRNRCEELKLDFHYHGVSDKLERYDAIKRHYHLEDAHIAYIGDDINDLGILTRCGLSATPQDARDYMKEHVDYVTPSKGGEGALRDLADMILMEQNRFDDIITYALSQRSDQ